nr:MAG TPA: hypothetical protein [Caudoviricetes sp.]
MNNIYICLIIVLSESLLLFLYHDLQLFSFLVQKW